MIVRGNQLDFTKLFKDSDTYSEHEIRKGEDDQLLMLINCKYLNYLPILIKEITPSFINTDVKHQQNFQHQEDNNQ